MSKDRAGEALLFITFIVIHCVYCGFHNNSQIWRRGRLVLLYFHLISTDTTPFTQEFPPDAPFTAAGHRLLFIAFIGVYYVYLRFHCKYCIPAPEPPRPPFIIYGVYCVLLRPL